MEERKNKTMRIAGVLLVLAVFLIILVLILTSGRETHISGGDEEKIVTGLECNAGSVDGAFFAPSATSVVANQVKITFSNDKVDKLFYAFEGEYSSYEAADQDNTNLHAKYNIYMGHNGLDHENLNPTFLTTETKTRINLYAKSKDMINRITAVLFFVDGDNVDDYLDYSRDQVANYYEELGFVCKKQN